MERVVGSSRGRGMSFSEGVAFVGFVWMMVQREQYVGGEFEEME
jgi:hypothetical protein